MSPKRSLLAICLASSVAVGSASVAFSADFGAPPEPVLPASQWRLSFTPYAWLTWLNGSMTVKGRSVDLDVAP